MTEIKSLTNDCKNLCIVIQNNVDELKTHINNIKKYEQEQQKKKYVELKKEQNRINRIGRLNKKKEEAERYKGWLRFF